MDNVFVQMENIEKKFPGVHALSKCRFELRAGEVHGLIGENGAGKLTSSPFTLIVPSSFVYIPARIFISVDFPATFSPIRP